MTTIVLPDELNDAPSVTYTVIYIDEEGEECEAQQGISAEEADAKVMYNKQHGWTSYKVEDKAPA